MSKKKIDLSEIKKVLIIQLLPIGDALLTTSYFQTLKNKIHNVEIHYLIFQKYKKAINNHPLIDKIISINSAKGIEYYSERIRIISEVRKNKYDLIIDQQNLPATQLIALLSGAKYKMGYEDARFNFAYNLKAKRGKLRYSASKKFDILSPLDIKEEKYELFFYVSGEAEDYISNWLEQNSIEDNRFICISPGSPVKKKKWKIDNFIELCKLISEKTNYKIVIVWAPSEIEDAKIVHQKIKNSLLAPKTDLMQISALLIKSKMLICNDGGLNHLAVASKVKTLAIFGKTDPKDWSPASVFKTHHHIYNDRINDEEKDSTFGITPQMVFEEVEKILSNE